MRVCGCDLVFILDSGLSLAAIAFLPEGEIEIITQDTNPILWFVMRIGFGDLLQPFLDGSEVVAHLNRIII